MIPQRIDFPGAEGQSLAARLDLPTGEVRAYALFAHCFTCGKDIFAASRIAQALIEHGIAVLRFDFTGLGASEGEFANTNFSSNVADLAAAAHYLRQTHRAPALLIGHSLGGAAVLAVAEQVPEARAVVTLAAPSDPTHAAMPLAFESFGVRDTDVPLLGISENGTVCQLVPCTSLSAAESLLRHEIDPIVCGLQFDESRMFDLLRKVKAEPATRSIPFLCVKSGAGALDRTIQESIEIAVHTLGAEGFYDLAEQRQLLGEDAAIRQIGTYIYRLVSDAPASFRQR